MILTQIPNEKKELCIFPENEKETKLFNSSHVYLKKLENDYEMKHGTLTINHNYTNKFVCFPKKTIKHINQIVSSLERIASGET